MTVGNDKNCIRIHLKKGMIFGEQRNNRILYLLAYLKQILGAWTVLHRLNFDVMLCDEFLLLALDEILRLPCWFKSVSLFLTC